MLAIIYKIIKFPLNPQVNLYPASPDTILSGAYKFILVSQIKIFDVACIIFQPKTELFKIIKFDVTIGV